MQHARWHTCLGQTGQPIAELSAHFALACQSGIGQAFERVTSGQHVLTRRLCKCVLEGGEDELIVTGDVGAHYDLMVWT